MRVNKSDLPGFVAALMYGMEPELMDETEAAYNLEQYKLDGLEVPDDITPADLAAAWNEQTEKYRAELRERWSNIYA